MNRTTRSPIHIVGPVTMASTLIVVFLIVTACGSSTGDTLRGQLKAVDSTLGAADTATQQAQDAMNSDQEGNP